MVLRYYNLVTDFYENAWGESFHFCRFAYGETFSKAIARHEHFLASSMGIKNHMKVLDVGCGVGGPAREIVKFTDCHVTGLNINEYQIQRATNYAAKENLSQKLRFVQADFMVIASQPLLETSSFCRTLDSLVTGLYCLKHRAFHSRITRLTLSTQSKQPSTPHPYRACIAKSSES